MGAGHFCRKSTAFDKESIDDLDFDKRLIWAVSGMQGFRESMEDAHIAGASLAELVDPPHSPWNDVAIFGVMDGHGGQQVACFCEMYLPFEIASGPRNDVGGALTRAFHKIDCMLEDPECLREYNSQADSHASTFGMFSTPEVVGCTAVVCCVEQQVITTANTGDSRAVLCHNGRAINLSEDHKPSLQAERQRIEQAGGWVGKDDRVNDDLALSRALGDLEYKQRKDLPQSEQIVSPTPDINVHRRDARDEFLLVACDGVWDILSSQDAVDFVRAALGSREDLVERLTSGELQLSSIVEDLLDVCVGSHDNVTAILVVFMT